MSTMVKRATGSPANTDELIEHVEESLRRDISIAQQIIADAQERLQKLAEIRNQPANTPTNFRYAGKDVIVAVEQYLKATDRPWPREHLVKEVLDGGVFAGKGENAKGKPPKQVEKSLDYHLRTLAEKQQVYGKRMKAAHARLKQQNDLIGLTDWPDSKFQMSGT